MALTVGVCLVSCTDQVCLETRHWFARQVSGIQGLCLNARRLADCTTDSSKSAHEVQGCQAARMPVLLKLSSGPRDEHSVQCWLLRLLK